MSAKTDELLEWASQRTDGLTDLGPDGWQEGFEHLVAAIPVDLGDDEDAVRRIENIVVVRLVNRLRIEQWYADHGEDAAAHDIEGMLMILGTGRSGTTATHYLLAVDPQFRSLRKWEIIDPVPPPDAATERDDPRRPREPVRGNELHIATADGPTEDRRIHELSFRESGNPLGLRTYVKWWREADHTTKFTYHERVLRLLQSHRPPYRWLLKSPEDMINLEPLAAHYPQARFVVTHRDPLKVIPSVCSVIADSTRQRIPHWSFDPKTFGRDILEDFYDSARRGMASRVVIGEDRFLDVGQPELNADPLGIAERIYEFAGLELRPEVRTAMTSWTEQNQPGSRGAHTYTAEEFGLTDEEIRTKFAEVHRAVPAILGEALKRHERSGFPTSQFRAGTQPSVQLAQYHLTCKATVLCAHRLRADDEPSDTGYEVAHEQDGNPNDSHRQPSPPP